MLVRFGYYRTNCGCIFESSVLQMEPTSFLLVIFLSPLPFMGKQRFGNSKLLL